MKKGKELFVSNYLEELPSQRQLQLFTEPKIIYGQKKSRNEKQTDKAKSGKKHH